MDTIVQARSAGKSSARTLAEESAANAMSENRKLGIWLDRLVSESKANGKAKVQVVTLTPELAALLLDRNAANRKINRRLVDTFASDIEGGRWSLNGEPVIISDTGELNDGQHRCTAVVESGQAIMVVLVVGVSRESRATLDQGRARTIGDYLAMDGHTDSLILGAAAGHLWVYRTRGQLFFGGPSGGHNAATKSEIRSLVSDTPGLARSVAIAGRNAQAVGGRAMVAFCHLVFTGQNKEAGDEFIYSLMSGESLKAGDPILYARTRLINERGRLRAPEKAELIFRAWNAWRRGDRVNRISIVGGPLPLLEK